MLALLQPPKHFSPLQIPNLVVWLEADQLTGLADGAAVSSWADVFSGSGQSLTQAVAAQKPLYKTGIVQGQPVVRFDGVNDYLGATNSALAQNVGGLTIFAILQSTAPVGGTDVLFFYLSSNVAGNARASLRRSLTATGSIDTRARRLDADAVTTAPGALNNFTAGQWGIQTGVFDYANGVVRGRYQGAQIASANLASSGLTSNTASAAFYLGWNAALVYLSGDVAAVLVYQRALSNAECLSLERFYAHKYGFAVA